MKGKVVVVSDDMQEELRGFLRENGFEVEDCYTRAQFFLDCCVRRGVNCDLRVVTNHIDIGRLCACWTDSLSEVLFSKEFDGPLPQSSARCRVRAWNQLSLVIRDLREQVQNEKHVSGE